MGVIWREKLMKVIIQRKFTKSDPAKKAWLKEFCCIDYDKADLAIV
jgi:hypothetical protein